MATVGLLTFWLRRLSNLLAAVFAPAGARARLAALACLATLAIGCNSFSTPRSVFGPEADGGVAPAYIPPAAAAPAVAAVPPVAAVRPVAPAHVTVARPDLRPPGVQLSPGVVVAPLHANVILVAGVYSPARELLPFQPVDWTLAPGSVGQIVTVGDAPNSPLRYLVPRRPTALGPNAASGTTFGENLVITRGTSSPRDDLTVLRGQTWIGLTSAVEGDSVVTALSPEIADPATRQQTAVVHWVDVRWNAPPAAAFLPGTRHTLTTRVTRQTTGAPLQGWLVRYTVAGGPPAAFAANGAAEVEMATDAAGQATVEILQPSPAVGVNPVTVRLARPAGPNGERLEIGTGSTVVNWTTSALPIPIVAPAPSIAPPIIPQPAPLPSVICPPASVAPLSPAAVAPPILVPQSVVPPMRSLSRAGSARPVVDLQMTGPNRTFVGGQVAFDVLLVNRADVAATGLVLTDRFDDGLVHAAAVNPIQKGLEPLAPHQARRLAINFKVVKSGRLCNILELTGDGGLSASAEACVQSEAVRLTPPPIAPAPTTPTPTTPSPVTPAPAIRTPITPAPAIRTPTPSPARAAANLKLFIAARANPIRAGTDASYQIVVSNQGDTPEPKVALSVTIPAVMQFVGAQDQNPSPATIAGQTVRFDPIKQLRPHESLVFEIRVRADRAGKAIVRATVTSGNLARPLSSETATDIFAEPK